MIESTDVFLKMYDILWFLNFLYLPQIMRQIFFHVSLLVSESILAFFLSFFHICNEKINLYNPVKVYLLARNQ